MKDRRKLIAVIVTLVGILVALSSTQRSRQVIISFAETPLPPPSILLGTFRSPQSRTSDDVDMPKYLSDSAFKDVAGHRIQSVHVTYHDSDRFAGTNEVVILLRELLSTQAGHTWPSQPWAQYGYHGGVILTAEVSEWRDRNIKWTLTEATQQLSSIYEDPEYGAWFSFWSIRDLDTFEQPAVRDRSIREN